MAWNNPFISDEENKRNHYDKLHDKLKDAIEDFDEKSKKVTEYYNSYTKAKANFPSKSIPSSGYQEARDRKSADLKAFLDALPDKRTSLISARDAAYNKYLHYKAKAEQE